MDSPDKQKKRTHLQLDNMDEAGSSQVGLADNKRKRTSRLIRGQTHQIDETLTVEKLNLEQLALLAAAQEHTG